MTIAVIIIYSRSFLRKEEANITILNIKQNEQPLLNLKENKQVIILNHYIFGISPYILFPASAFYVVQNKATKVVEKTPLLLKNCANLQTDISDLSDKFKTNELLEFQQCLEFEKETMIGEEKDKKVKRYISIELNPCLANCYSHNLGPFPPGHPLEFVPMPYEMTPYNPLNALTGLYPIFMHEVLLNYIMALVYANTATDLNNFEKPISRALGIAEQIKINLLKEMTINL